MIIRAGQRIQTSFTSSLREEGAVGICIQVSFQSMRRMWQTSPTARLGKGLEMLFVEPEALWTWGSSSPPLTLWPNNRQRSTARQLYWGDSVLEVLTVYIPREEQH